MKLKLFVVALFLACNFSLVAQIGVVYKSGIKYETVSKNWKLLVFQTTKNKEANISQKSMKTYRSNGHKAFFCKMETKLDKKLKTPIRFRLGSYDYVNRMEGKF